MIIVKLMGGMGNQMFQYAMALRLATGHQTMLKLDLSFLLDRTPGGNFEFREFALEVFPFKAPAADAGEVRRFRRLLNPGARTLTERVADQFSSRRCFLEEKPGFDPRVLDLPADTYLEGYFQDERYFADIAPLVREHFHLAPDERTLPASTRSLADEIRGTDSICIQVRRGDFVNNPEVNKVHGICSLDYYLEGLKVLRERGKNGKVFVFSDDAEWCRQNLGRLAGVEVVGEEHAGSHNSTHLWLMTLCKSFVLSNSSFGWWAAWLCRNPDKTVVRPDRWFKLPGGDNPDICPRDWIKLATG